jgi:hypothetical protein
MQSDEKISPEDEDDDPMELDSPVMASQLPVRSGKSSILGILSRVPRTALRPSMNNLCEQQRLYLSP